MARPRRASPCRSMAGRCTRSFDPRRSARASRGIEFWPELPLEYRQLVERWPQGNLSKAYAAYETPFWRAKGLSGQALSDSGPVFITFDVSPSDRGPGILLGFADARTFDPLPSHHRREAALGCFADIFGDAALDPIDYLDHCWSLEPFAPGGPTAAVPPGIVDHLRAMAAAAGRPDPLGGHRDRRRMDGLSWTARCVRAARRCRSGRPAGRLAALRRRPSSHTGHIGTINVSLCNSQNAISHLISVGTRSLRCPDRGHQAAQMLVDLGGRSRMAQWPPGSSTKPARLGTASAILRDWPIGSSRSFVLPITNAGTVSPSSGRCCGPSASASIRAQPPRATGDVPMKSS